MGAAATCLASVSSAWARRLVRAATKCSRRARCWCARGRRVHAQVGVSWRWGHSVAGMLLADSEYRTRSKPISSRSRTAAGAGLHGGGTSTSADRRGAGRDRALVLGLVAARRDFSMTGTGVQGEGRRRTRWHRAVEGGSSRSSCFPGRREHVMPWRWPPAVGWSHQSGDHAVSSNLLRCCRSAGKRAKARAPP